ncbi:MAG: hypothetical protein AAF539_10085 [Planctomycetota bacterium]
MSLVDPTCLFTFEVRILRQSLDWTRSGLSLPQACRVPSFSALAGGPIFGDLRLAWAPEGLGFSLAIAGKRQMPWCRETRLDESDGLHLWFDTRNSPNIHRATQHCHRFLFLPAGGGPRREKPVAVWVPINRARANPKPVDPKSLLIHAVPKHDGYEMSGLIPANALTGYDPLDQSRLGFYYRITDRERGDQSLSLSTDFPVEEDPSLWGRASLLQVG